MFNLIIGFIEGTVAVDRVLEHSREEIVAWAKPGGSVDLGRLQGLPTLVMPELQDFESEQVARVGHLRQLTLSGRDYRYEFEPYSVFASIDTARIEELAVQLDITNGWEFNRHHWAVKDVDLMHVLGVAGVAQSNVSTPSRPTPALSSQRQRIHEGHDAKPPIIVDEQNDIFIVHGHDEARKHELFRVLHDTTGMRPVILHEQPSGGRAIIEKLEKYARSAGTAVVLLTADDVGRAKTGDSDRARARQNVVYEAGYFAGRLGRDRVVLLHETGIEQPSDLAGVIYTELDRAGGWKVELLGELQAMGFNIDWSGLRR